MRLFTFMALQVYVSGTGAIRATCTDAACATGSFDEASCPVGFGPVDSHTCTWLFSSTYNYEGEDIYNSDNTGVVASIGFRNYAASNRGVPPGWGGVCILSQDYRKIHIRYKRCTKIQE